MFTKIYTYLMALSVILIVYSCKKDQGNYTYTEINEVSQFGGVNDTIASYGKRFTLKPALLFTKDQGTDTSKYTYEWTFIGKNGFGGESLQTFAKTRNLDVNMTLVADTYFFYYGVTDKETGVKYTKDFKLTVQNEINEGWLLMCDVNGTARLDFINKNMDDSFTPIPDLLKTLGSELTLKGKPVMVNNYATGLLLGPDKISYGIYLGTDQGTEKVEPDTYKWTSTMNLTYEMYGDIPPGFYADVLKRNGSNRAYMLGKENVYLYERPRGTYFSVPINYIDAEKKQFSVAPFIGVDELTTKLPCILYDKTNKRFVKHTETAASCTVIPDPAAASKLFSFKTGMDLLYMECTRSTGGTITAVLKDPSSEKRYLARFNNTSNAQTYYAEVLATDFALADQYAISPELGYLFYTVGSKVYEYDFSLKTTKLMLDKGNEKITLIKFQQYKATKYTDGNKLIVCSYNPSLPEGSNGKMEEFTVPSLNEDLVLYTSYTGIGKVQSLSYRER